MLVIQRSLASRHSTIKTHKAIPPLSQFAQYLAYIPPIPHDVHKLACSIVQMHNAQSFGIAQREAAKGPYSLNMPYNMCQFIQWPLPGRSESRIYLRHRTLLLSIEST